MINLTNEKFSKLSTTLLCRGSTFCVKQPINTEQVNLDLAFFYRTLRFAHFFHTHPLNTNTSTYIEHTKTNHDPPKSISNTFETQMQSLENRFYTAESNHLTAEHWELKNLQKLHHLKFCRADKGGCLIIISKTDYNTLVEMHLKDINTYKQLATNVDEATIEKIKQLVAQYSNVLLLQEKQYLSSFAHKTSKFYVLPKIHKSICIENFCKTSAQSFLNFGYMPSDLSSRPIINNIQSPTSHLSHFIDALLTPLVENIPGYIRDTFDFLNKIPRIMPKNATFISMDVVSLYTNIPVDFGLEAIQYWLTVKRDIIDTRFPTQFILHSLELILKNNNFTYNKRYFQQISGVAMGTKVAPKFANLVMAYLEVNIQKRCKEMFGVTKTTALFNNYWRFLDDIFLITVLNGNEINELVNIFNNCHPNFKFTHEVSNMSSHFLDVTLILKGNEIETDIYSKPTDSHQYLHFLSNHPAHIKRNIPYNLAFRIKKIVSNSNTKDMRLDELRNRLISLRYPHKLIEDAITKSFNYNTKPAIHNKSVNCVFEYSRETLKFYKTIVYPTVNNISLGKCFPHNFSINRGLRQPKNILQSLSQQSTYRVKKCLRPRCKTCSILIERNRSITINNKKCTFNCNMSCVTRNVIYILICNRCKKTYVGQTTLELSKRINLHRQHINNPATSVLYVSAHMRICGYDYSVIPIFCTHNSSTFILQHMESYFIYLLQPELNRDV